MTKKLNTIVGKINLFLLFGLCLGVSNKLYATNSDVDDEKGDQINYNEPGTHQNDANEGLSETVRQTRFVRYHADAKKRGTRPIIDGWFCSRCRFINKASTRYCKTCNAQRSLFGKAEAPIWKCGECSTENKIFNTECKGCENPAPPSSRSNRALNAEFIQYEAKKDNNNQSVVFYRFKVVFRNHPCDISHTASSLHTKHNNIIETLQEDNSRLLFPSDDIRTDYYIPQNQAYYLAYGEKLEKYLMLLLNIYTKTKNEDILHMLGIWMCDKCKILNNKKKNCTKCASQELPIKINVWDSNDQHIFDFSISISYADGISLAYLLNKTMQYINNKEEKHYYIHSIDSDSFIGAHLDNNITSTINHAWKKWINKKITTWNRDEIIKKGLELTIENRYHHSPKKAKISCPHIKDRHRLESSGLALALRCSIYRNAKKHYAFGKHVLDHLNFSNHFSDEYHEKAVCKYGTACYQFIRLEKGGYLDFSKNSTNLKKLTEDLCHIKIFRHPPRNYRHLRINQNIHQFIWNKNNNTPLYEPVDKEKKVLFKLLLDEVIKNGYQYDLCLICNKDNKCNHDVYKKHDDNNLRSIITDKFNHIRYKKMGQPLHGKPQPANTLMLSLLLYTRGDSTYDLCNAQRNGNYDKWKMFDYYLWHAIHYLSKKEYGPYTLYAGLHKTKQKETNIKSVCFPTYAATTIYKEIAESSLDKQGGMVIQINPNMHNAFICCDVSWISRFPDEHEIVIARTSSKMMKLANNCSIKPLGDKGRIQTLLLTANHADIIPKIACMLRAEGPSHKVNASDKSTFNKLISGAKGVPADTKKRWNEFRHQQKRITIDMRDMYDYYKVFIPLLVDFNQTNLLLFDKIVKIFPNVIQIICKDTDYDITYEEEEEIYQLDHIKHSLPSIISSNFILGLQRQLKQLQSKTKLAKIIIQTKSSAIKDNCKLYPTAFAELGWAIGKTGRWQISLTKASFGAIWKHIIEKGVGPKILSIINAKSSDKSILTAASVSAIFKKLIKGSEHILRRAISIWKRFCDKQERITIDMLYMYGYYQAFTFLLVDKNLKNLLLFDTIAKIFPNVTQIICKDTDWDEDGIDEDGNQGDYSAAIVGSHFICGIKDQLSKMDKELENLKKKVKEVPKLKKIIIQTKQYQIGNDCNLYAKQFDLLGWKIAKGSYPNQEGSAKKHNQITLTRLKELNTSFSNCPPAQADVNEQNLNGSDNEKHYGDDEKEASHADNDAYNKGQHNETLIIKRPTHHFQPLLQKGRPPGGSSMDIQYFKEVKSGGLWIGKCNINAYIGASNDEEYREALGFAIYRFFGIITPEFAVSVQPVAPSVQQLLPHGTPVPVGHKTYYVDVNRPCIHIMSQFLEGFSTCADAFKEDEKDEELADHDSPFMRAYKRAAKKGQNFYVRKNRKKYPLKSLGTMLAVANFIYDINCIGKSAGCLGYRIQGNYAQVVKIDPGHAFSFLEEHTNKKFHHNPMDRKTFFGTDESATLGYDQLTPGDQQAFAAMAKRILQTPREKLRKLIYGVVVPGGWQKEMADKLLDHLIARKSLFLAAFALEIDDTLRQEITDAKYRLVDTLVNQKGAQKLSKEQIRAYQKYLKGVRAWEAKVAANRLIQQKNPKNNQAQKPLLGELFQLPNNAREDLFTGRQQERAAMAAFFGTKRKQPCAFHAITGVGGTGKTHLALHYAHACAEGAQWIPHRYDALLWLYADAGLDSQFHELAKVWGKKDFKTAQEAVTFVYQALQQQNHTLLVFDNAEQSQAVGAYLPPKHQKGALDILITTRNPALDLPHYGKPTYITLAAFTKEEGRTYIQKVLGHKGHSQQAMDALWETVSGLPLALNHALQYIAKGECSLAKYPARFAEHQLRLGAQLQASPVVTSILLSVLTLREQHPLIEPLLVTAAYLAPEKVPTAAVFTLLDAKITKHAKEQALAVLHKYGLLTLAKDRQTFDFHRLVQQVLREWHRSKKGQAGHEDLLEDWMAYFDQKLEYDDRDLKAIHHITPLIPHACAIADADSTSAAIEKAQANLYFQIGYHQLSGLAHYNRAKQCYEKALAIKEKHYGVGHIETAGTMGNLGNVLAGLGDYVQAKQCFQKVLKIEEKHYGAHHPETAKTMSYLGEVHRYLGDYALAKEYVEKALKIQEKHYGADHPETAMTIENLGKMLLNLGDYAQAKQCFQKALKINEKHYGAAHPTTATVMSNLGTVLINLGDYASAKQYLEKALKIFEQHYGADHPTTATTMSNLALLLQNLGNYTQAKIFFQKVLKINEKHYGADHPTTAITMSNLGNVLQDLGEYAEAKTYLQKALKIQEQHYGVDHPETAKTMASLGNVLSKLGDYASAKTYLQKALKINTHHYGDHHPETASTMRNLGNVLSVLGDYTGARTYLEKALKINEQHYGDDEKDIKGINSSSNHIKEDNTNNQQAKPTISIQNDQSLQNEDNEELMFTYDIIELVDWSCQSIKSCKALNRIITCLQIWQVINNDMSKLGDIVKDLSYENNYKEVLGAYHHLLDVHLNGKNNKEAFKFINDRIKQNITCDFDTCKGYDRNQRDRIKESVEIKQYGQDLIFIRDTLDTIHAYLIHGSDSGHIYVKEAKPLQEDKGLKADGDEEKDDADDEADNNYTLVDQEMADLAAWQGAKKKNRTQGKTKFNTTLEDVFKSEKKIVTAVDNLIQTKAKAAQEVEKNKQTASYGFGSRLYYWNKYKHNTNIDHDYNPGYRYSDLYVPPASPSLKTEILAQKVSIAKWRQKIYAAKRMLSLSPVLRKSKAVGLYKPYGIKKGAPLALKHILAIFFYTDFTGLCTAFGRSFWSSSAAGVRDIVKKNAKWHHLAKYLREVVECFGTRIDGKAYDENKNAYKQVINIKGDTYYHGVSYLLFTRFSVNWYGPLSTSKKFEVATFFTSSIDNGLVLDLKEDNPSLRFFNVSFLSDFGAEDERLFIGGYQPIQIANIRLLKDKINLKGTMHALFIVNSIIRGKEPGDNNQASTSDGSTFSDLRKKPTKFSSYARQIWDGFRHQQQRIKINMAYMYSHYKIVIPQLCDPKCKNLLCFDQIAATFPNVTEIRCEFTDYDGHKKGYFADIVGPSFIEGIEGSLRKMDENTKLKKIIIQTREHQVTADNSKLYATQFGRLGWKMAKGNKTIVITKEQSDLIYQQVMAKFSAMLKAEKSSYEVISLDAQILKKLMANENIPAAVQREWKKFKESQKEVKINIRHMYKYYRLFAELLSDQKCKNLLLFDQIANMFPNVTEIICENTDWDEKKQNEWGFKGSYSASIVSKAFIAGLQERFQQMPKQTKLRKVMIRINKHEVKDDLKVYATQFKELGWQLKNEVKNEQWVDWNSTIALQRL